MNGDWIGDEWDCMGFLCGAGVDQKKCLPLSKGPASERIGRVLWKSVRNYFWGEQVSKVLELAEYLKGELIVRKNLESNIFDCPTESLSVASVVCAQSEEFRLLQKETLFP
jgi:hypothetical protein